MKKFTTIITTVFMLMALATTAFAAETSDLRSAFKENNVGVLVRVMVVIMPNMTILLLIILREML